MDEIGNQTEATEELDYILPEGYNEETDSFDEVETDTELAVDTDVKDDETETEEATEDTTEDVEAEKAKLSELLGFDEYKYNHEVGNVNDLTPEKAKMFMQLGMKEANVDNSAREQNNEFLEVAEMFEMDADKLMETLRQQYFDDKASKESRNVNDVKTEYESSRKTMQDKMVDRFVDKYPDIPVDKLTEEVMDAVAKGQDMTQAYEGSLKDGELTTKSDTIKTLTDKVAELEKQLGVKKQNAKTKSKGVVKSVSGSDSIASDDFLAGLLGE